MEELAAEHGGRVAVLDVTDPASVARLAEAVPDAAVVVHSAGGALGLDPVREADEERWRWMYDANLLGVLRVTKALLPALLASRDGHVVVLGSVAGRHTYSGGGGYTAAKHAVRAFCRTLREELLGEPVRVTEVAPGMVETEFSLVRFAGDAERAAGVYAGMTPLTADDVADVIAFAVTRPPHVDLDVVELTPRAQLSGKQVHRE
ncbi:MAG: SDR family NAD(P)-dependent oxidoreductase [Actinomycetota bacterium]|nr:SDR family NAD(P)-dependent oxidoreductase [Actinomycetota bacterium]